MSLIHKSVWDITFTVTWSNQHWLKSHPLFMAFHLSSSLCGSEEDDALYEKLSGEQWRLEVLMQLLNELKDSDLPGDFFLELLQVQTFYPE